MELTRYSSWHDKKIDGKNKKSFLHQNLIWEQEYVIKVNRACQGMGLQCISHYKHEDVNGGSSPYSQMLSRKT